MGKILKPAIFLLICLSLFTPLIVNSNFFFPFVGPKSLYFFALSEAIFFLWLILISVNPQYRPQFNLILLTLSLYILVFILSSLFGIDFSYSFWSKHERMTGVLMHLHLFSFFLVLSSTFGKEDFEKIFGISIFVAELAGLYGISTLRNPIMRGGGTLGNESFLGTYLLFNLFFALYLIFEKKNFLKMFAEFSFVLLFISLLMIGVNFKDKNFSSYLLGLLFKEGARAAKISFYGGLGLLFLLRISFSKNKILKIFGLATLFLSFLIISIALYSIMFQPNSFFRSLLEKEVGSFGGRFFVWEIAKKGFFERPILGWGPENFEFVFFKHFNPCFGTEKCGADVWYDRAHNIVFDTLVQTGIFGLISYFSIFFAAFYSLWKNFFKNKTDFWTAGIFTSLFVSYFVQNLTVFDMVSSFLVFFLSLSFLASFEKKKIFEEMKEPNLILIFLCVILFFISSIYFVFLPVQSSVSAIRFLYTEFFEKEKLELAKKAIFSSPLGRNQIRQFLSERFLSELQKEKKLSPFSEEIFNFFIQELKKNIQENKMDFKSYLKLGEMLNLYSLFKPEKGKEAEEILKKAINEWPQNQMSYWELAQTMVLRGEYEKAIDLAQKALDLEKNLERSHLILISLLRAIGKKDLAEEKLKEAIKINPNWEKDFESLLK